MTTTQVGSQRTALNINRIPWRLLLITASMLLPAIAQVKPATITTSAELYKQANQKEQGAARGPQNSLTKRKASALL